MKLKQPLICLWIYHTQINVLMFHFHLFFPIEAIIRYGRELIVLQHVSKQHFRSHKEMKQDRWLVAQKAKPDMYNCILQFIPQKLWRPDLLSIVVFISWKKITTDYPVLWFSFSRKWKDFQFVFVLQLLLFPSIC